jgi:hypothetical protein
MKKPIQQLADVPSELLDKDIRSWYYKHLTSKGKDSEDEGDDDEEEEDEQSKEINRLIKEKLI